MSNLFQGVSSKMDALKVPLRFNTESEKQNFLQIFPFSFLPLFLTQEVNKLPVLMSPCMDLTIFKHFPPPHNPQWHNKTAERQAGRPRGLVFSHWWTPLL